MLECFAYTHIHTHMFTHVHHIHAVPTGVTESSETGATEPLAAVWVLFLTTEPSLHPKHGLWRS